MKGRIAAVICVLFLTLPGCGADVDVILQNGADDRPESSEEISDDPETREMSSSESGEVSSSDDASVSVSGIDGLSETVPVGICVYICGAVEEPGVYEAPEGSRIYELVEMAGGLTADADETSVNLAQSVEDGTMVRIPTLEETESGESSGWVVSESGTGAGETSNGKVNINTAGVEELMSLNGIGEVKAAAIVDYREEHGFFKSTEEIMQVSGIGEGIYDRIKEDITV